MQKSHQTPIYMHARLRAGVIWPRRSAGGLSPSTLGPVSLSGTFSPLQKARVFGAELILKNSCNMDYWGITGSPTDLPWLY